MRRTVFTETVPGLNPEQTNFENYREVGGVKLLFTMLVSYLGDKHYGTTRNYIEIKNLSISDEKFSPADGQKK